MTENSRLRIATGPAPGHAQGCARLIMTQIAPYFQTIMRCEERQVARIGAVASRKCPWRRGYE